MTALLINGHDESQRMPLVAAWLNRPAIVPKVGGCYQLRAGLKAFVESQVFFAGIPHFKGILFDGGTVIWHDTGHYSPTRQPHELDIVIDDNGTFDVSLDAQP